MDKVQQLEERILKLEQLLAEEKKARETAVNETFTPSWMGMLRELFKAFYFDKFNVRRLLLTTGQAVNPSVEGEIVYHSTTTSIKVYLNGAVKTFTVS